MRCNPSKQSAWIISYLCELIKVQTISVRLAESVFVICYDDQILVGRNVLIPYKNSNT